MTYSKTSMACIIYVLLCSPVQAEIYEEKDAQGNPVFTDTPVPGATEIGLPQTNTADAVMPSTSDVPAAEATTTERKGGNVVVIPNTRNEELERNINADKPHEVLEAEQRYEVGDTITPEERARREAAKEGVIVDEAGNVEHIIHRGHHR